LVLRLERLVLLQRLGRLGLGCLQLLVGGVQRGKADLVAELVHIALLRLELLHHELILDLTLFVQGSRACSRVLQLLVRHLAVC